MRVPNRWLISGICLPTFAVGSMDEPSDVEESLSAADGVEIGQQAMSTSIAVPRKGDIRAVAEKVGNYWMTNNPCNAGAGNCPMSNSWDKGVLMMGIVDHWRKHPNATAYKTYALNWANEHSWQLYDTDPCNDWKANWHNRMIAGYTYLRLKGGGVTGANLLT